MAFTHLHVHTEYSLLDGSSKIKEIAARAKALGMDSLAITDHGVMYGVIDFYRACREVGIKPILGCEVYVAPNSRLDREAGAGEDRYHHLVLLAETNEGYANLTKIVSRGFIDGYYYRPRVDKETLRRYHTGIIALSACLAGEVSRNLLRGQYDKALLAVQEYRDIFGEGNYFLELQDHGLPEQRNVNMQLHRLSEETGIPLVATNDVHYTYKEDAEPHDLLLCLQTGKKVTDENRMRYEGGQYYLKSEEEMRALFPYAGPALDNTHRIAERIQVEIEFGVTKLPRFDVPEGFTAPEYLEKLCKEGLARRYEVVDESLSERLSYELQTIAAMGYVDYFLIVWDFIRFATANGISVGPGRGSAAGSLVSYCLGITNIDPVRYRLLFERFLNPERVSMPDIDIDFCFERRGEVIDYVTKKYGNDCVVQIVTFGTLAARGVVRDVGRVLDYPYALCDKVAKLIPRELNITLEKALEASADLKKLYLEDPQIHKLIDMSMRLEGLPRHASTHAAGVVICREPVDNYVPLSRSADGQLTTQFTMTTIEELGLLKMDFLGLRTLTVIQQTERLIRESTGKPFDIGKVPYDDEKVFAYIGTGHTEGIFQLESAGMKSFMKELRPRSMEDIIAGISLYRPGPMDFIPQYIRGKNSTEPITYHCPQLKPILEPTYGCIVYQEQVMQIVRDLGGYTLGRSDMVRRAMSKKKEAVMQKERQNFVYGNEAEQVPGCLSRGISAAVANKIFDEMTDFAKYAFNKSHAAAYAVVAYQTAYLKYYYPVEFMASLMTSVIDVTTKVTEYIRTARQMGIRILPPDISEGGWSFSVSNGCIRYGLSAIRGVGRNVIENIVAERRAQGPFLSLKDFIDRLTHKEVNKRTIESFIKAGALDSLPGSRHQKMLVYADLVDRKTRAKKEVIAGQMSLFDMMGEEDKAAYELSFPPVEEYTKPELLAFEKEVLGLYVSGHPLEDDEAILARNVTARLSDFRVDETTGQAGVHDGEMVTVGGMITAKTLKTTKNGKAMAFLTLEDMTDAIEVVVFPRDYEDNRDRIEEERRVFVRGRVSLGDETMGKLTCERMLNFEEVGKDLWIAFENYEEYAAQERSLRRLLMGAGATVYLKKEKSIKRLTPSSASFCITPEIIEAAQEAYGKDHVAVKEKKVEDMWKMRYTNRL